MRELIDVREILKEVYEHILSDASKIEPKYSTTHKYGQVPQSKVHEDNEAYLKFASLPKMSSRTKYIALPYHFFRSNVINLEVKVLGINTDNQMADQFTKGLPRDKFERDRLNLVGW